MGDHTSPPTNPHPKSSSSRAAKGPQETAKLIWEKKAGAAGAPQAPYMELSQKKRGGGGGWKCPPLLRALTPGKKAAYLVLALQGMLGGTEGRNSFPLCIPFVATILNSLLPILLQAMADDAVAFLTLQRPVSHGGAGPRHREGPGWDTRRMQLQLGRGPS